MVGAADGADEGQRGEGGPEELAVVERHVLIKVRGGDVLSQRGDELAEELLLDGVDRGRVALRDVRDVRGQQREAHLLVEAVGVRGQRVELRLDAPGLVREAALQIVIAQEVRGR